MYPNDFDLPEHRITDFSKMELWIEFKNEYDHGAFPRPSARNPMQGLATDIASSPEMLRPTLTGFENRSEMSDSAAASMGLQFRAQSIGIHLR